MTLVFQCRFAQAAHRQPPTLSGAKIIYVATAIYYVRRYLAAAKALRTLAFHSPE
ncbi:hypothetical protein [Polymorphobacter megasporae]|uniref:hypothetical protein n=1 Tax=Glacieibacterium megasporae TaxID=2835787 RepID=UPI001C1DFD2B|nr:hypothetical protein [Polymorphobacter megasporae]UAJ12363.1 hypothetical protein KTC28_21345 [Polymorphobacter megasporae]